MRKDRGNYTPLSEKRKSSWRRMLGAFGLILLTLFLSFVGATLAAQGAARMSTVLSLNKSGVERDASVLRIDTAVSILGQNNRHQVVSLPVIEFDYQGRRYEFTVQAVSADQDFSVGEQVTVVFPPEDPDSAVLSESRNEAWAVPMALGVVLLLVALVFGWAAWMMCFGRF